MVEVLMLVLVRSRTADTFSDMMFFHLLLDRFGIRRTDERFWAVSDRVLADYQNSEAISHGVLDYSRYENR